MVLCLRDRYHSHPHITVLPSHVDVRTQAMYQSMDEGFIGLIFSVFNQVTGFSLQGASGMCCFLTLAASGQGLEREKCKDNSVVTCHCHYPEDERVKCAQ